MANIYVVTSVFFLFALSLIFALLFGVEVNAKNQEETDGSNFYSQTVILPRSGSAGGDLMDIKCDNKKVINVQSATFQYFDKCGGSDESCEYFPADSGWVGSGPFINTDGEMDLYGRCDNPLNVRTVLSEECNGKSSCRIDLSQQASGIWPGIGDVCKWEGFFTEAALPADLEDNFRRKCIFPDPNNPGEFINDCKYALSATYACELVGSIGSNPTPP